MQYLHTMLRVKDLEKNLNFFCQKLGFIETERVDNEAGKFSLIFLAASADVQNARKNKAPVIELTYNWPDESSISETYEFARGFGHLAYQVENIYETCTELMEKGVIINRPPRDGYMAFIKSPEGASIELLQAGLALPPQEPWKSMENIGSW